LIGIKILLKERLTQVLQNKYFIAFIIIISFTLLKASDLGKLRGKVLTNDTNIPLMGVNVVVVGTYKGTFTDNNGNYTILGIPSGEYDIRFEYIGYAPKIIQKINIQSNLSTTLDVKLVQTVIAGEEVVVSGKRSIIQVDETASKTYLDADDINKLPVIELRDAVMLQAGVFFDPIPVLSSQGRGHAGESGTGETRYTIRGGDQEEIMWLINGSRSQSLTINARDAGGSFMNMNSLAIKEIQILSGGFTAEYGNAQSGVVNVIMKEGEKKYNGSMQLSYAPPNQRHFGNYLYDMNTQKEFKDHMVGLFYNDSLFTFFQDTAFLYYDSSLSHYVDTKYYPDYDGDIDSTYYGDPYLDPLWYSDHRKSQIFDYRNTPDHNLLFTFGGPIPFSQTGWTFQISGQSKQEAYTFPQPLDARTWKNINLSLSMPLSERLKIKLFAMQAIENHGFTGNSDWSINAKYYRGYGGTIFNKNQFFSANLIHTLNENFFYDIQLSYYSHLFHQKPSKKSKTTEPYSDYALTLWGFMRYPQFSNEPFDKYNVLYDSKERASDISLMGRFNWQINYQLNLKYGFEYNYNIIKQFHDYRFTALSIDENEYQDRNLHEKINPKQFATYLQGKMEFESMVLNMGLRYDRFNPNFQWFSNFETYNIAINPNFDSSLDPDGDQIDSNGSIKYGFENVLLQQRESLPVWEMLSPRIGVSFPITENTLLHYNYGYFYQMPPISRMRYFRYFRPTPLLEQIIIENDEAESEDREPNHIPGVGSDHERVVFLNVDPLPPQKTIMVEIGLKHNYRDLLYFSLTAYHRDIYNQSEQVIGLFDKSSYGWDPFTNSSSSVITDTPLHGDYGDSRGFELELRSMFSSLINININYSFSKVTQGRASPHKVVYDSTGIPSFSWYDEYNSFAYKSLIIERQFSRPHILKAGLNFSLGDMKNSLLSYLTLNLMYRYVSGQTFTYLGINDNPTTYDNHRYPGLHFTDLKIEKRFYMLGAELKAFMVVNNLFNKKNIKSMGDTSFNPNVVKNFVDTGKPTLNDIAGYDMSWSIWYPPRKIEFGFLYAF